MSGRRADAYIGLGANLGNARDTLLGALEECAQLPLTRVVRRSSLYRSAPVGYTDQPDFVNAVAQLESGLSARELLEAVLAIETRHGRARRFANSPRTLDIDLLLRGESRISEPGLELPHPRMHERRFVLEPLAEIAPGLLIPGRGSVRDLLARCLDQFVRRMEAP